MIIYKFGAVLLVPFPFTDQTTIKKRPTVVISSHQYNQEKPDLILMAVTSQIKQTLQFGEMLVTEWSAAGLLKPSIIKPIITTIEKNLVLKNLGQLQPKDLRELHHLLQLIVGT